VTIMTSIEELVSKNVPERKVPDSGRVKWENKKNRKIINKKAAAYHQFQMSRSYRDYQSYASIRNKVTDHMRSDRRKFEMATGCKKDTRKVFAYYHSKTRVYARYEISQNQMMELRTVTLK